jgi:chemotaxis protein methyltransferase CheR
MRWLGYRRVRGQVCKRVQRRLDALGLAGIAEYRVFLESHEPEWAVLDGLCGITVSRFFRDAPVFQFLGHDVLPALARAARARGDAVLRCWSAGCASGEEPYSLALLWESLPRAGAPRLDLDILATDTDQAVLRRAREARFAFSSLRELPEPLRALGFLVEGQAYVLKPEFRHRVRLSRHDLRAGLPDGPFDLIACRNLAFTYYQADLQVEIARGLRAALHEGGALVLGMHEALPREVGGFRAWSARLHVYRRSRPRSR